MNTRLKSVETLRERERERESYNLKDGEKGITLIALIVTIIVLLILAMVSVNLVLRNNLIDKAQYAKNEYEKGAQKEEESLNTFESEIDKIMNSIKGSNTEAKEIEAILTKCIVAIYNEEEDAVNEALKDLGTYGISSTPWDENPTWLMFNSKEDYEAGNSTMYCYSKEKEYLYKFSVTQNSEGEYEPKVNYIASGTDTIGEALLTKALDLKKHLEDIFIGKTLEEIKTEDKSNGLIAYVQEGYDRVITKASTDWNEGRQGKKIEVKTEDFSNDTNFYVYSEDGVTYSYVYTEIGE